MSWTVALLVGGLAGWLVTRVGGGRRDPLAGIVLGVLGAAVAGWLVTFLGMRIIVRLDQLIAGAVGGVIAALALRR